MRPNTSEYAQWLPEMQEKVRNGQEIEFLGFSVPTDTTPGHLGLPERVHEPEMLYVRGCPVLIDPLFTRSNLSRLWNKYL
jgi:hypothetical protein